MFSLKRLAVFLLVVLMLFAAFACCSTMNVDVVEAEATGSVAAAGVYTYYNLSYVFSHQSQLKGAAIATRGIVRYFASIFMFEDFWLEGQGNRSESVMVVVRFAGLPVPREMVLVEVRGIVEYSNLEGGFFYINASLVEEVKNVLLIGWDGVQRNHLFELLSRGALPNLQSLVNDGKLVNVTVSDHRTDTKSGWTQILTGYRWWRTGVFNNVYWFHSIPAGFTIIERIENYFGEGNVATGHITGKLGHMEVLSGSGTTATGAYTHEAIYSNVPSHADVCNVGDRNASVVGPSALRFIENYSKSYFFGFFHFSDPDSAGHNQRSGGENSDLYEQAIIRCDYWLGQIINKLNVLNLTQNTLIFITADHGFDEGGYSHNFAPYVFLATNDKRVGRNGDQSDVAPTIYYASWMWGYGFSPALDGYPLQVSLPEGVEQRRQSVLADNLQLAKPSIISPGDQADLAGVVCIQFNASDKNLCAVLLLIDNTLVADGSWTWRWNGLVEASGSFDWDTSDVEARSYNITVLAFDEHGATNGLSTRAVTVNVVVPQVIPNLPHNLTPRQYPSVQPSPKVSPHVLILSPANMTYAAVDKLYVTVRLLFEANGSLSWVGYSLDGGYNVTVFENGTLIEIPIESRCLRLYANDTAGNWAAAQTVQYDIAFNLGLVPSEPSPTLLPVAVSVATAIVPAVGVLIYLRKRKHRARLLCCAICAIFLVFRVGLGIKF